MAAPPVSAGPFAFDAPLAMLWAPLETVSRTASTGLGDEPLPELLRRAARDRLVDAARVDPLFLRAEADWVLAMRVLLLREL
jgi:hypothetical protein